MNEIFVIINEKYSFVNLIFENYKNEFIFFNEKFNFRFVDINKLEVFNDNSQYILYTDNSFIFYDNKSLFELFKLITLSHNEWFDQALLNYNENKIIRIKDRNQFGTFNIENNRLKINWNFWGEEDFIKYDENIYVQDLYKIIYNDKNIIFIHFCNLNNGYDIFMKQLNRIINSNVYDYISKIYILWIGPSDIKVNINQKMEIIYLDNDVTYYEFLSINKLRDVINNYDDSYNVLYIHNKGTMKSGNENVVNSWREMMEYFLIDNANYCINNLDYYDTIGCNLINKCDDKSCMIHEKHAYHYSGNFWWSKVSYLKLLVKLEIYEKREEREKKRYQCENWVLSKCDNKNIGVIYQDNTNLHPYHRYIFDNYKKEKLLIKKKIINLN